MEFPDPLIPGRLLRRYKRFLADIELADGREVVAHCANPGSMLGLIEPGAEVWLSPSRNPKRKLHYSWELVRAGGTLVGINTSLPNGIVEAAIIDGAVPELAGYESLRREVPYGENSRIDILLEQPGRPNCLVEVKSVTLSRHAGLGEFPDSVTIRGAKHLKELAEAAEANSRAVMFFLAQRSDCTRLTVAQDIDPAYAAALHDAVARGVEVLAYNCDVSPKAIALAGPLPFDLPTR